MSTPFFTGNIILLASETLGSSLKLHNIDLSNSSFTCMSVILNCLQSQAAASPATFPGSIAKNIQTGKSWTPTRIKEKTWIGTENKERKPDSHRNNHPQNSRIN